MVLIRFATFYCRLWQTVGSTVSIAFVDVDYKDTGARAACVLTESWEDETPHSTYVRDIDAVEPFVTAIGIELEVAAQCVRHMAGKHRIPEILRITDCLSRSRASTGDNAV